MSTTSYNSIVETSIDLDMTPGAVMPVVNASQTDDLRLLTIYLYANGTQYYLHHPSFSHEELSIVLNGKKPDGNIFSYKCEFDYDSNKVWAYFNKQMTAVAGEVLCELVVYATSTEEEDAEPRQVGSANFVLQVEESPTGGPDSESTLQSLDQIRHELYIATADSRQSASNAATSEQNAALSASQAQNAEAAAKSWAVGPSGTGSGTDTNNSKYYHDQVSTKYAAFMNAMDLAFNLEIDYGRNNALSINHTFQEVLDAFRTYGHLVAFLNYHPNTPYKKYYIGTVYLVNDIQILFTFNMSTKTTTHIMLYTLTSDDQLVLTENYEQVNQAQLTADTGIDITDDSISVKLATNSGLDFDSNDGLQADVKDVQIQGHSIVDGNGKANIKSMRGATSSSDGERGLVPWPLVGDQVKFLRGDGRWATPETMSGATSSSNGSAGFVPQPLSADADKFLKGDGTWATPAGGGGGDAPIYPIALDVVTADHFQNITDKSTGTLVKNLPYTGDATSNKKWLDNFRTICDMCKTNNDVISKYINVGLITDYADDSAYGKTGRHYDCMMDVDTTMLNKADWGTSCSYSLSGRCRFHYFDSADGNKYVDAPWIYTVIYDYATDTFSTEFMHVSLTQYS